FLYSTSLPADEHQHGAMHHSHDSESMHHAIDPNAKLVTTQDGDTIIYKIGPLHLPAHTDHMKAKQAREFTVSTGFDGWVTAYHPRLVDAKGNRLPNQLLHHVAFWNASRSDFLCTNKEEHIFGAGGEMNDWPSLPGLGYQVRKSDRIRIDTMFNNP